MKRIAALAAIGVSAALLSASSSASVDTVKREVRRPCSGGCNVGIFASSKPKHWVSSERLRGDVRVSVLNQGHKLAPSYYRHGNELCVAYFSGYGATAKVNVCGEPYHVRVTAQAFKDHTPLHIRYRAVYPGAAGKRLSSPFTARQ